MTRDYAEMCADHWHCCVTLAAHKCDQPNRLQPCPTCGEAADVAPSDAEIAALKAAGDLLYLQVLDANGWINLGATWPGAGLCICTVAGKEKYQPEDLEKLDAAPTEHDIVCTPFRAALAAWKSARPERV